MKWTTASRGDARVLEHLTSHRDLSYGRVGTIVTSQLSGTPTGRVARLSDGEKIQEEGVRKTASGARVHACNDGDDN